MHSCIMNECLVTVYSLQTELYAHKFNAFFLFLEEFQNLVQMGTASTLLE